MSDYQPILGREAVAGKELFFFRGMCQANFQDWKQPREYDWNERFVIRPLIESGHINDGSNGPFDDRKLRYDRIDINEDKVLMYLGITHFSAYKMDLERNEAQIEILKETGEKLFNDRYAFFSRPLALTILPITKEGTTFIGERGNSELGGKWNAVAGYFRFKPPEDVDPQEDIFRELEEEFGLSINDVVGNPKLVGISCSTTTGEAEPSYIVQTNAPEEYFTSGRWMQRVKVREHKRLARIATLAERDQLLKEGHLPGIEPKVELMHATEHVLRSLKEENLRGLG